MKQTSESRRILTRSKGLAVSALARVSQEFGLDDQDSLADSDEALFMLEELLVHLIEKDASMLKGLLSWGLEWLVGFARGSGARKLCHGDSDGAEDRD
jgi:hypothetical protein